MNRRTVGAICAALVLLTASGCGDGGEQELADAAAAAERADKQIEDLRRQLREALEGQRTAESRAKTAAEAAVSRRAEELQKREQAVEADAAALLEREKAVGLAEAEAAANTFTNGTYIVGDDISPGTYKSAGGSGCYWARLDASGGIIDNNIGDGPSVLVVRASDFSIEIQRCDPFIKQ